MKPVVLLMGPTASGKTQVAFALAKRIPLEIISVDSALIYRGMNIGTAKPTVDELTRIPHHLIDILDPSEHYSAARFCEDALRLIDVIHQQGKVPLLVGGTMLYFKALRTGLDVLPPADRAVREKLDQDAQHMGWPALHSRLAQIDPSTAARIAPNDAQRIQRALEVFEISGKPLSSFFRQQTKVKTNHQYFSLALEPSDRSQLHQYIEQRFDAMLAAGFIDEVKALQTRSDLHVDLPAMRCVGYRQAWEYCQGNLDWIQFRAQAIAATRQLAKRQLTWLRRIDDRIVFDCLRSDLAEAVGDYLLDVLVTDQLSTK